MDPATALGIAAAAVQFLQFSLQVLDTCRQIRDDAKSSTRQNRELEDALRSIKATRKELEAPSNVKVPRRITEAARGCIRDSDELLKLLEYVRGAGEQASTAKKTFRALKERRTIEKLERGIKDKQEQLNQTLVQGIWSQTQLIALQQSAEFTKLSSTVQDLLQQLLQQKVDGLKQSQDLALAIRSNATELDQKANQRFETAERNAENRLHKSMVTGEHNRFLASLFFPEIDHRRDTIKDAAPGTLDWLYDPEIEREWDCFADWLSTPTHSTYWVSGKAGSGKSTLMAHIVQDARTTKLLQSWSGSFELCIISFYFWRPGSFMQNSTIGLLRSLLYQLCQAQPAVVESLSKVPMATVGYMPSWTQKTLISAIEKAIQVAGNVRFAIFIDGLDEFTGEYNDLLDLVLVVEHHENVKLCLSSRPEVEILRRLSKLPKLRLERLNSVDIRNFVQGKLEREYPSTEDGNAWIYQHLLDGIASGSNGIFLWAALVTRDVLKGLYSGDDGTVLLERIDSTPRELEEIYSAMIEKLDPHHAKTLGFFFQCVRLYNTSLPVSTLAAARLDGDIEDHDEFIEFCHRIETQALAQSGGFLELSVTGTALSKRWSASRVKQMSVSYSFEGNLAKKHVSIPGIRREICPNDEPYPRMLDYEGRFLIWIHRSAYDSLFGAAATKSLTDLLPNEAETFQRLSEGCITYFKAAPSFEYELFDGTQWFWGCTYDRIVRLIIWASKMREIVPFPDIVTFLDKLCAVIESRGPGEITQVVRRAASGVALSTHCCQRQYFNEHCADQGLFRYLVHRGSQLRCRHLGDACILAAACNYYSKLLEQKENNSDVKYFEALVITLSDGLDDVQVRDVPESRIYTTFCADHMLTVVSSSWKRSFETGLLYHKYSGELIPDRTLNALLTSYETLIIKQITEPKCIGNVLDKSSALAASLHGYTSYGFHSLHLSLQFPTHHLKRWIKSESETIRSFRIVCLPRLGRIYRQSYGKQSASRIAPDIVLSPKGSSLASMFGPLFSGARLTKDDLVSILEKSQGPLIDYVWENKEGLGSTEQLYALACVRVGLKQALLESDGRRRVLSAQRHGNL